MVKDKLSGAMVGNVSPDALGLRDGLVDLAAAAVGDLIGAGKKLVSIRRDVRRSRDRQKLPGRDFVCRPKSGRDAEQVALAQLETDT